VFLAERKVMGISQWRSREGSLFHTCAYAHWDADPLIDLLDVDPPTRKALRRDLPRVAAGILDFETDTDSASGSVPAPGPVQGPPSLPQLRQTLLTTLATWEKDGTSRPA
jgi:hypothetical protein